MGELLLVDDNISLVDGITTFLENKGFRIQKAFNGRQGLSLVLDKAKKGSFFDVIILDRNMGSFSGDFMLQELRKEKIMTPTILLTALDEPKRRVEGLSMGADDYLVKPFFLDELLARIQVQIRKKEIPQTYTSTVQSLKYNSILISRKDRYVENSKIKITLTSIECEILLFLALNKHQIVTKKQLLLLCRSESSIEVHIHSLRNKLKKIPEIRIKTIYGKGYEIL